MICLSHFFFCSSLGLGWYFSPVSFPLYPVFLFPPFHLSFVFTIHDILHGRQEEGLSRPVSFVILFLILVFLCFFTQVGVLCFCFTGRGEHVHALLTFFCLSLPVFYAYIGWFIHRWTGKSPSYCLFDLLFFLFSKSWSCVKIFISLLDYILCYFLLVYLLRPSE